MFSSIGETHGLPVLAPARRLTDADVLVIQLSRSVAEVSQPAVLAVLASGVVLAADACDDVQVVDEAAAIRVAVALTVWGKQERHRSILQAGSKLSSIRSSAMEGN